jgi:hypothetical protein
MAFRTVDPSWWVVGKNFAGFMWSPEWKFCARIGTVFALNETGLVAYADAINATAGNALSIANTAYNQVLSYDPTIQAVRSQEFKNLVNELVNFAANDPSGNPSAGDLKTYADQMLSLLNSI